MGVWGVIKLYPLNLGLITLSDGVYHTRHSCLLGFQETVRYQMYQSFKKNQFFKFQVALGLES